jgi:hypothetical protein
MSLKSDKQTLKVSPNRLISIELILIMISLIMTNRFFVFTDIVKTQMILSQKAVDLENYLRIKYNSVLNNCLLIIIN